MVHVYTEGSLVIISPKNIVFLYLKIYFVLGSSADPDEMPHYVTFHLDLLFCLPKYPFRGFPSTHSVNVRPNKKDKCVWVRGLNILGREGTHIFLKKKKNSWKKM